MTGKPGAARLRAQVELVLQGNLTSPKTLEPAP
jgi:hypothetical protein